MDRIVCPHCDSQRIRSTRVPKGVVAVMPCPECSELVVFFRRRLMALDRSIIENGTKEERKLHIADIIAEFLEEGVLDADFSEQLETNAAFMETQSVFEEGNWKPAARKRRRKSQISQREFDRFTKFELEKLDNPDYFKRHLG